jgi:hypothetical protein
VDRLCETGIDAVQRIIRDGLVDAQNVIHALK